MESTHAETAPAARMTAGELADLMRAFNEVTARLEGTHDQLRSEVERLTRELSAANQELERSRRLAALGEMAAGISHEVRNPVGSIRLYARMLVDDLADRPQEQRIAVKVGEAARALDAIVGDVLTFAREFKVQPCWIRAGDLFEAALDASRSIRGSERVAVSCRGDEIAVWADPGLAQQAVVNIVRNAFEALLEGGIEPARVELSAFHRVDERKPDEVVLRIRDSGPGIADGVIERIFNPFFTTRASGTGLGLSIVHRIAEAHGGRVLVANNRGVRVAKPQLQSRNRAKSRALSHSAPMKECSRVFIDVGGTAPAEEWGIGATVELAFPLAQGGSRPIVENATENRRAGRLREAS